MDINGKTFDDDPVRLGDLDPGEEFAHKGDGYTLRYRAIAHADAHTMVLPMNAGETPRIYMTGPYTHMMFSDAQVHRLGAGLAQRRGNGRRQMTIEELARCQRLDHKQIAAIKEVMSYHEDNDPLYMQGFEGVWEAMNMAFRSGLDERVANPPGGDHYTPFEGTATPDDFIAAHGLLFRHGCIVKYICRYKRKGGVDDLDKALHYARKLMEDAGK